MVFFFFKLLLINYKFPLLTNVTNVFEFFIPYLFNIFPMKKKKIKCFRLNLLSFFFLFFLSFFFIIIIFSFFLIFFLIINPDLFFFFFTLESLFLSFFFFFNTTLFPFIVLFQQLKNNMSYPRKKKSFVQFSK